MFASYFDESGTHNKRFLVVAGYTAEVDRWANFSHRWNSILVEHGLSHFHAKEFRQAKSKIYAHLSQQDKNGALSALVSIIAETAIFGSLVILSPHHYDLLTTPKFRSHFGTSFGVAAAGIAACSVARLQEFRPGNHRLGIFFEQGHKNITQALDLIRFRKEELEELDTTGFDRVLIHPNAHWSTHPPDDPLRTHTVKIGAMGIGGKRDMPPLQAADLLAYCVYSGLIHNDTGFAKAVIDELDRHVPHYFSHLSPEKIKKHVEKVIATENEFKATRHKLHLFSKTFRSSEIELVSDVQKIGIKTVSGSPLPPRIVRQFDEILLGDIPDEPN
ncbi:MAG: DUF3800 domain-containing protein [Acidobacteriaceae bacterium]|nr:DUF3800 domain-containing protein [Acidobacteriaceae bacterium]